MRSSPVLDQMVDLKVSPNTENVCVRERETEKEGVLNYWGEVRRLMDADTHMQEHTLCAKFPKVLESNTIFIHLSGDSHIFILLWYDLWRLLWFIIYCVLGHGQTQVWIKNSIFPQGLEDVCILLWHSHLMHGSWGPSVGLQCFVLLVKITLIYARRLVCTSTVPY